jgi:hypothetical protein
MFRHALLALTMTVVAGMPLRADPIVGGSHHSPYGPLYSASSSPFESFEWTSLDFAAFSAYGGDFVNVRRPVTPVTFFDDPMIPAEAQGPEDEQVRLRLVLGPTFEDVPVAFLQELPREEPRADAVDPALTIAEPGVLILIGLGLLGASLRLRTYYAR